MFGNVYQGAFPLAKDHGIYFGVGVQDLLPHPMGVMAAHDDQGCSNSFGIVGNLQGIETNGGQAGDPHDVRAEGVNVPFDTLQPNQVAVR
jgi:hypothetical protein